MHDHSGILEKIINKPLQWEYMKLDKAYLSFISQFKALDDDKLLVAGVVGSDDSIDRHGDRINPKGWDLKNFKKSPVILLNHNYWSLPIGKAVNVRVENNQLLFDIEFSQTYDVAKTVYNLVKENIMKAVSVGFLVKEWARSGSDYTIEKAELLELSFVTVPANPNALSPNQKSLFEDFCNALEKAQTEHPHPGIVADTKDIKPEGDVTPEAKPETVEVTKDLMEGIAAKLASLETTLQTVTDSIDAKITEKIDALTKSVIESTQSDADSADDPTLLALTALGQELKEQNQGAGKALRSLNLLLEKIQEKE